MLESLLLDFLHQYYISSEFIIEVIVVWSQNYLEISLLFIHHIHFDSSTILSSFLCIEKTPEWVNNPWIRFSHVGSSTRSAKQYAEPFLQILYVYWVTHIFFIFNYADDLPSVIHLHNKLHIISKPNNCIKYLQLCSSRCSIYTFLTWLFICRNFARLGNS